MLRTFWCNDSSTTLRTLSDWPLIQRRHGNPSTVRDSARGAGPGHEQNALFSARRLGQRYLSPYILQVLDQYRRVGWLGGSRALLR